MRCDLRRRREAQPLARRLERLRLLPAAQLAAALPERRLRLRPLGLPACSCPFDQKAERAPLANGQQGFARR